METELRANWKLCPEQNFQRRWLEVLVLYLKRPRAKSWELRRCGGALQIQRLEVLVLYLKRPRAKSWELRRCGGALQIQRLEGSRLGGLWDLYLDKPALIVCEFEVGVRVLRFQ
jgi:hypothetical protein